MPTLAPPYPPSLLPLNFLHKRINVFNDWSVMVKMARKSKKEGVHKTNLIDPFVISQNMSIEHKSDISV